MKTKQLQVKYYLRSSLRLTLDEMTTIPIAVLPCLLRNPEQLGDGGTFRMLYEKTLSMHNEQYLVLQTSLEMH